MKRLFTMFGLSALLALAPDASAQQPVPVAAIGRWDVAGQLALLNRNKTELGSRWDHWYEAPLIQGSLAVVFALLMVSAREGIAQSADEAIAWQTVAQKLDAGVTVDVRLRDSQHFKATFIAARPDAIVVQRKSRVPVGIETIAYESVASLARVDAAGLSRGKVPGIAFGAEGATVGALLLFISLLAYD